LNHNPTVKGIQIPDSISSDNALSGRYGDVGVDLLINSDYRNDRETHELMASEVMPHFA